MEILVVAATKQEIPEMDNRWGNVDVLITGVGMVATTFHLTKALADKKYHLVINAGIAGSFDPSITIGQVVEVVEDRFSEIGVEDKDKFVPAFEMGLLKPNEIPFKNGVLLNPDRSITSLSKVKGITVNTVHGNEDSIKKVNKIFSPQVETMEGAAFFYVCLQYGVPFVQIRGISNYVEERNKDNWDMELAIANLNQELKKMIQ